MVISLSTIDHQLLPFIGSQISKLCPKKHIHNLIYFTLATTQLTSAAYAEGISSIQSYQNKFIAYIRYVDSFDERFKICF